TLLAVVPPAVIGTGTLAMPGGELAQLLRDSPTFGPVIDQGLAEQGLTQRTTLYDQFFRDAQTAVDARDPIYVIAQAPVQHPIHPLQVVGTARSPPAQVVPNPAPQGLITASMYNVASPVALTRIPAPAAPGPVSNAGGFRAYVNFTAGSHGSMLDPT